jgi:hypothetical protein
MTLPDRLHRQIPRLAGWKSRCTISLGEILLDRADRRESQPMPKPKVTKAKFDDDQLNGTSSSTGYVKGDYLGAGYHVATNYRTLVWLGTITGGPTGGKWPFEVFPTAYFKIEIPTSDMVTVTVTNPTGQTSDPKDADPQPVIVP